MSTPGTSQQRMPSGKLHAGHRQRVRKRYLLHGESAFCEEQLLELLLFYSCPRRDTVPLALRLMERFGSLQNVVNASVEELRGVKGVGESTAVFLNVIGAAARVRNQSPYVLLETDYDLIEYLEPYFVGFSVERIVFLCGTTSDQIISCDVVAEGTENAVSLNEEMLRSYVQLWQPDWIVLSHNHTGRSPEPSESDRQTTLRCRELLREMDVELRDHIIFAGREHYSMRRNHIF